MQTHIRTAEAGQFSEQAKFAKLHDEGQLQGAEAVAKRILHWLIQPVALNQIVIRLDDIPA
jgi:hypothetical protein